MLKNNFVLIASAIFFFSFFVSFLTIVGGMNSGDGTNYSLTKAIIENHTISLNYQKEYTLYTDYSINDNGDWISDREPGVSLLALPYYIIGKALAEDTNLPYQGTSYYQENLNEESKIQIWTYSSLSIYIALLLSISFILLTKLKVKHSVILVILVNVFFGSLLLKYSASFSRNAVLAVNNLVGLLSLVVFDKTKKKKYFKDPFSSETIFFNIIRCVSTRKINTGSLHKYR